MTTSKKLETPIKLSAFNDIINNKRKYLAHTQTVNEGDESEAEELKFYSHPEFPEGIFLKETYRYDSYGSNMYLSDIQFVEGKEKTIIVYDPI